MGRSEKRKAKLYLDEEDKADDAGETSKVVVLISSDDEDGNEDLSLKIVEKSLLMRATKLVPDDAGLVEAQGNSGGVGSSGVVALSSLSSLEEEVVEVTGGFSGSDVSVGSASGNLGDKKVVKRERKKKNRKMQVGDKTVIGAKDEEKEETVKDSDIVESVEPSAVEINDNIVFRKLLRGPRYFDPPDNSWGTCFNCGEEGHSAVNCTAVKRKKPCFVCGSLEHNAKQCSKGQDCFICKRGGHRAKDCPEKHKGGSSSSKFCLKCGESGHDMFMCSSDYSPDDLKEIRCYACKRFGHLCCVNSADTSPRAVSCYRCGQLGHTGLACSKVRGEASGIGSPSSCFKCGEEGHFARECMGYAKANKRSREFLTPMLRLHREEKDYSEFKSLPLDLGKVRKRKKSRNEEAQKSKHKGGWIRNDPSNISTPHKSKHRGGWIMDNPGDINTPQKSNHRGGWIMEHPGDISNGKYQNNSRMFPATPSSRGRKTSNLTAGGHVSRSQSPDRASKFPSGSSKSKGSSNTFQHRFSASRFGNSGPDGMQRNHSWW